MQTVKRSLCLALILCAGVFAGPKIAPDLPKSGGQGLIEVIVRFTHPPTKDDLKLLGPYGQVKKNLDIINGVDIALSSDAILALASNPVIAYISPHECPVKYFAKT